MEGLTGVFFSICILGVFLLAGKILRVNIKLFQRIFLPASIIGGFLGLFCGPYVADILPHFILDTWQEIPGILINFVFATLFLGLAVPGLKVLWAQGGSQLCFGMVAGTGQYFFALLVTILVLIPFFDVSPIFATILEIGLPVDTERLPECEPFLNNLDFRKVQTLHRCQLQWVLLLRWLGVFFISI